MGYFLLPELRILIVLTLLVTFAALISFGQSADVDNIAGLRQLSPDKYDTAVVAGYYQPGDGGGGTFHWDASITAPDNGGTTIAPNQGGNGRWIREVEEKLNVKWFGAQPAREITGNVHISPNSSVVRGDGTVFTEELSEGDWVSIGWHTRFYAHPNDNAYTHKGHHRVRRVASIQSDTELTLHEDIGDVSHTQDDPNFYHGLNERGVKMFTGIGGHFFDNRTPIRNAVLAGTKDSGIMHVHFPQGIYLVMAELFPTGSHRLHARYSGLTVSGESGDPDDDNVSVIAFHPGADGSGTSGLPGWMWRFHNGGWQDAGRPEFMENVTVRDLCFDGRFVQWQTGRGLIIPSNSMNFTVENVWVRRFGGRTGDQFEYGGGSGNGLNIGGFTFLNNVHAHDNSSTGFVWDGREEYRWEQITAENITADRNGIYGEIAGRPVGFGFNIGRYINVDIRDSEFNDNWIGTKTGSRFWTVKLTNVEFKGTRYRAITGEDRGRDYFDEELTKIILDNVSVDGTITNERLQGYTDPPYYGGGISLYSHVVIRNELRIENVSGRALAFFKYEGHGSVKADRIIIRPGGTAVQPEPSTHRWGIDNRSGPTEINYLEIDGAHGWGMRIGNDGGTAIKSGKIFNNYERGIWITGDRNVDIRNVAFGDTQDVPTQTVREIADDGSSTVRHGGLDFSQSKVSENYRITVHNPLEAGSVYIEEPGPDIIIDDEKELTIRVQASHPSANVTRVEFYANGEKIGERSGEPFHIEWTDLEPGSYTIKTRAYFDDNSTAESNAVRVYVSGHHSMILQQGWNTISSFIKPNEEDIETIFTDIQENISLVLNNNGDVYWPAYDINEIGTWDFQEAYQVYMNAPATLTLYGEYLDPENTSIYLKSGWNLKPYIPGEPMPVDVAFRSIESSIEIVTNNAGDMYWPAYGVNSIGDMQPGEGYKIYATRPSTLTYPVPESLNLKISDDDNAASQTKSLTKPQRYKIALENTGSNAFLLLKTEGLQDGDEVGIWNTDDILVGSGVVGNNIAAITIWGRNTMKDNSRFGARDNELLRLTLWSDNQEEENPLRLKSLSCLTHGAMDEPVLRYEEGAVLIAGIRDPDAVPERYALHQNYPNPFNPTTTIEYTIPRDEEVTLQVYNLLGQKIKTLVDEGQKAGTHRVVFKANTLSSGVYFYRLIAGNYTEIKRMIVLR